MNHTIGKWIAEPLSSDSNLDPRWIVKSDQKKTGLRILLTTVGGNDEANARRVVQCCNSFDELLNACKKMKRFVKSLKNVAEPHGMAAQAINVVVKDINKIIAAAEKG